MGPSSVARNAMVNAASVPAQNPTLKRTAQAAFEGAYSPNSNAWGTSIGFHKMAKSALAGQETDYVDEALFPTNSSANVLIDC